MSNILVYTGVISFKSWQLEEGYSLSRGAFFAKNGGPSESITRTLKCFLYVPIKTGRI